jgi:hypothetical protein
MPIDSPTSRHQTYNSYANKYASIAPDKPPSYESTQKPPSYYATVQKPSVPNPSHPNYSQNHRDASVMDGKIERTEGWSTKYPQAAKGEYTGPLRNSMAGFREEVAQGRQNSPAAKQHANEANNQMKAMVAMAQNGIKNSAVGSTALRQNLQFYNEVEKMQGARQ